MEAPAFLPTNLIRCESLRAFAIASIIQQLNVAQRVVDAKDESVIVWTNQTDWQSWPSSILAGTTYRYSVSPDGKPAVLSHAAQAALQPFDYPHLTSLPLTLRGGDVYYGEKQNPGEDSKSKPPCRVCPQE
ncbi:hypothetical protein [Linepithema humile C virus 1]|uniref:Uncharacterized protein n=1 Tax=Linepithema humile C virus 1 TaxID=2259784 RepID=A0AC61U9A3_9VIRU|nr:hypothetical protein [Linepithema humile C-virus 1]